MKRSVLFWSIIALFGLFIVSRLGDLTGLYTTLASGRFQWVLAAIVLQVVYFALVSLMYRQAMAVVGIKYRVREMAPVVLGSIFVSGVTPAGEAGGFALFVDDARRRGNSPASAAAGALIGQLGYFLGLSVSLALGFAYLLIVRSVGPVEIFGVIAVTVLTVVIVSILLFGARRSDGFGRVLGWIQWAVDAFTRRLLRRTLIGPTWARDTAEDFREASSLSAQRPREFAGMLGAALASQVADIATLAVLFVAFGQTPRPGPVIATFSIAMALWSVLPFQGIGVVEATMTVFLQSFGVPSGAAAVISLSFRGLTFWIPLGLGFVTLRRTQTFSASQEPALRLPWSNTVIVAALLVGAAGVIGIASWLGPEVPSRVALVSPYLPSWLRDGADIAAGALGIGLIICSVGLFRRSVTALRAAMVLLVSSSVVHVVKGLDVEEAALCLAVAALLFTLRPALGDHPDEDAEPEAGDEPAAR